MPKIVDNYVLERKIGNGQFGDVFKGYDKSNNQDIAIKVVKRELLKGKFTELLENEIRVLKTCNNDNIIKLYDIKKTSNNFYLIMEYCNEGDLMAYLKKKKQLTEDESIEYLIQILNAFKTLTKHNVMHRDFKLANILKHNGNIKIAYFFILNFRDFGFAKLLGEDQLTSTMLGSPLNMAPEVLNGQEYDNKVDIWSIGTVFYEILFGKPPYTAGNMIDLIKNIKTKQIDINRKINNISAVSEDILRKMLIVDPKKRIDWDDLFKHEINRYLEDKIKKDFEETMNGDEVQLNMSRFYIKNNKVIDHPAEIEKKEQINDFALKMAKQGNNKNNENYNGAYIKRQTERKEEEKQEEYKQEINPVNEKDQDMNKESMREQQIRMKKRNANRILHERNIYVFLASVAEDAINNPNLKYSEIVGFLLVKKLLQLVDYIMNSLTQNANIYKLEMWDMFIQTKDFKDIYSYIKKEHEVFSLYFQSMYERLIQNPKLKSFKLDADVKNAISNDFKQNIDKVLQNVLKEYCEDLVDNIYTKSKNNENQDNARQSWIHADRIIDCLRLNQFFLFEDEKMNQFNFKLYYEEDNNMDIQQLIFKVEKKIQIYL